MSGWGGGGRERKREREERETETHNIHKNAHNSPQLGKMIGAVAIRRVRAA